MTTRACAHAQSQLGICATTIANAKRKCTTSATQAKATGRHASGNQGGCRCHRRNKRKEAWNPPVASRLSSSSSSPRMLRQEHGRRRGVALQAPAEARQLVQSSQAGTPFAVRTLALYAAPCAKHNVIDLVFLLSMIQAHFGFWTGHSGHAAPRGAIVALRRRVGRGRGPGPTNRVSSHLPAPAPAPQPHPSLVIARPDPASRKSMFLAQSLRVEEHSMWED